MKIPYYNGNIYDPVVVGHLTLEQWANANREPKLHVQEILHQVSQCGKDHKRKQELKTKLFYVTPSVFIPRGTKRQYTNIEYFTGYAQLDFDKLNSIKEAQDLRDYLFNQYDCIMMAYLSPSKLGVKCIIQIPRVQDVEEYKDYYAAIETQMKEESDNFDHAPFNCVLPLFISMDPDLKYRPDPTVWTVKEDRTVNYAHLNEKESECGRGMTDAAKSLHTIAQFKTKIDEIVDGDGHPRMRSACLVLGSRAGAEYIDIQQATELAHYCIESNGYLRKKLNTYLKSADWAINQGYRNPAYY